MFTTRMTINGFKITLVLALLRSAVLNPVSSMAGGLLLYEVGTADIGLASAGYNARAQDASIVFTNPTSTTKDLDFDDTWHAALGTQYRINDPWLLNFGIAYDSKFQDNSDVSPVAPLNSAWRFGIGAQHQVSERFYWGVSAEYLYGGTLDVDKQSILPVNLGGRCDVEGSYDDTGAIIAGLYGSWKF